MTKAKKVLSLVLAVVMVAAMFAFSASAANEKNATFTVSVDNATVSKGDVITVTVNLTTDYYAGPTNVPVYYNPAFFEFVAGSVVGTKIFGETATDVQFHNDAATGCLKVAFIPNTADGTAAPKLLNGTLFTFQLRAIADGTSDIGLHAEDQKTATNIGGTLYCGAYAGNEIDNNPATVGQDFAITNASATVGSAVANTLVVKDTYAGKADVIIDKEYIAMAISDDWYPDLADAEDATATGLVYGVDTLGYVDEDCPMLADVLSTTLGDEYLVITTVDAAEGSESTGAKIEVLDSDKSTVLETYYFIYFGDVNGDGVIENSDITELVSWNRYGDTLTTVSSVAAADCNGDAIAENSDVTALVIANRLGERYPVQTEVAAAFYAAYHDSL